MGVSDHHEDADRLASGIPHGTGDLQQHDEMRRFQERIASLTKQHKTSWRQLQRQSPSLTQQIPIEADLATAPSRERKAEFVELPHGAWMRRLDPVVMPPPPQSKRSLSGSGRVAGYAAAFCVAAGIALAMANFMRPPIVNTASRAADRDKGQSFSKTVLTNMTRIPSAEAKAQSTEQPSTPALAAFAALRTNDALPGQLQAATSPPAQPSIVPPQPAAVPEQPASPILPRNETVVSPAETAAMLKRGRDLIAAGDIASARLILQHMAEAGSAEASLILAGTFDREVLSKLGAFGLQPDPAKARAWYARAAEQGSEEARRRLQRSALR